MSARKSDTVVSTLLARIVRGELAVGSFLPTEAALAEEFGVNRSVVREAIKRLEVHRLVRPIRRKGTEVLDPIASLSPQVLQVMLMPRPQALDRDTLAELLEIRTLFDVAMCGYAAERRTEAQLAELEALAARVEAAGFSPRAFSETIDAMADVVARASGNRIFAMLLSWSRLIFRPIEDLLLLSRLPRPERQVGLRLLVEAIRARDADTARRLMSEHHRLATADILAAVHAMSPEEDSR